MAKEVARSYTEMKSLGFKAFEKSHAYSVAKQEIFKIATQPSEVSGYLYVDYQSKVIVQDLLGRPNATDKARAMRVLQFLAPSASHRASQSVGFRQGYIYVQGLACQLMADKGQLQWDVARHTSVVVCAIILLGLAWYAEPLLSSAFMRFAA